MSAMRASSRVVSDRTRPAPKGVISSGDLRMTRTATPGPIPPASHRASTAMLRSAKITFMAVAKAVMAAPDQLELNRRIAVRGRLLTGRIEASVRMLIQRSFSSISWRA